MTDAESEASDAESSGIGGWQPVGGASIRAVPSMSDQFYRLAGNLRETSRRQPTDISLPAGTVIVGIAALEAYVNEVAHMALRDEARGEFENLRDNLRKKLQFLNERGKTPGELESVVAEDVVLLYGLRGILMHYRAEPEHPIATTTSLQRLTSRFPEVVTADAEVSVDRLLTPSFAAWAVERVTDAIRGLYRCGWDPPRPRWFQVIDPDRLRR